LPKFENACSTPLTSARQFYIGTRLGLAAPLSGQISRQGSS
jgi:hypothetical protein